MKRISLFAATLFATALALGALPAQAQYANEFTIAKVIKQGTTTQPVAGKGTVEVKVQVNADGTHKVIGVLKSTNPGDEAAALEIAANSTYRPAHKGKTPVVSFYSFVLKFDKPVASASSGGPIEGLIRAGKYPEAIARANMELLNTPGNPQLLQLLGVAQFYNNDEASAANSFSKVPTISKDFSRIAASAFANAAVKLSVTDAAQSLAFAQKAVALDAGANSNFALGVAQIANKQYPDAISTLKGVHDKVDAKTKLQVDRELLTAYLASNDTAGADGIAAEMKQLDPNGNSAEIAMGSYYISTGNAALQAKDFDAAFKAFDRAAGSADPKVSVTGDQGATLALLSMPKPDYAKAKDYASKWVTAAPDDPQANYYAGLAYVQLFANVSHSDKDKAQGVTYLKKADTLAKGAGNVGLSLQIENTLKAIQP